MLVLTQRDIRAVADQGMARAAVREAARATVEGRAVVPPRIAMAIEQPAGEVLVMPGHLPAARSIGVKVWSRYELADGATTDATILFRLPDDALEVVLDGSLVTDLRTGAMSAVAAELLARQDAATMAIVGAGIQARAHLDALSAVLPALRLVRVVTRSRERRDAWLAWARDVHPQLQVVSFEDPGAAVRDADIVVTATTSRDPVFPADAVASGTFVCGVGSHDPDAAEIPVETVARAAVVAVDTRRGGVDGAGDIRRAVDAGLLDAMDVVELGELVDGRVAGRSTADEVTVFKSVGFAALDLALAGRIVAAARRAGLGLEVDLH